MQQRRTEEAVGDDVLEGYIKSLNIPSGRYPAVVKTTLDALLQEFNQKEASLREVSDNLKDKGAKLFVMLAKQRDKLKMAMKETIESHSAPGPTLGREDQKSKTWLEAVGHGWACNHASICRQRFKQFGHSNAGCKSGGRVAANIQSNCVLFNAGHSQRGGLSCS